MRSRAKGFSVCLIVATGVVLQSAAFADDGDVTATNLVEYCGVSDVNSEDHTAIAFCYGYIDAALDYHHAITANGEGRITCPPKTVSRQEVAGAVVEWAKINTDKIDDNPPIHVVMQAVSDKWPCK